MKQRFWMYRRSNGVYYCEDSLSGEQKSLGTRDSAEAERLFQAKVQASQQPSFNRQLAKIYQSACDPTTATRTWDSAFKALIDTKDGVTRARWIVAAKDKAYNLIRDMAIADTQAEHFLKVLKQGKVSTNVYLRRVHNFALDMGWLIQPVLVKRLWPKVKYKDKRAITLAEHQKIIQREGNAERKAFYELAWHLGASQSDIANLRAEHIDWANRVIAYHRQKTRTLARISFGSQVERILRSRPTSGYLFPYLQQVPAKHRATEFGQRCQGLKIEGVSLHSYRYAWAQRALSVGFPERYAMCALGHSSNRLLPWSLQSPPQICRPQSAGLRKSHWIQTIPNSR